MKNVFRRFQAGAVADRNLGFELISPAEALKERPGRTSNVLLENIRAGSSKKSTGSDIRAANTCSAKKIYRLPFKKLKNIRYDGLLKTNEAVYDLFTLGTGP